MSKIKSRQNSLLVGFTSFPKKFLYFQKLILKPNKKLIRVLYRFKNGANMQRKTVGEFDPRPDLG